MPVRVIGRREKAPTTGSLGDMYFDVATNQTFAWGNGHWVLVAMATQPKLEQLSQDPTAAEAERRAEEFRAADANTRHGKMLMTAVFQDTLRANVKKHSTLRTALPVVQFGEDDLSQFQGADHFVVQMTSDVVNASFRLRYDVVRHLMNRGMYTQEPQTLDDISWQIVNALAGDGARQLGDLLDRWHEDWRQYEPYWRAIDEEREQEALKIYLSALAASEDDSGGGGGHGQFPGDTVS